MNRNLKLSISVIVVFIVIVSLIFSNVIPFPFIQHIKSPTIPISTNNNTTSNNIGNSNNGQNTTSNKTTAINNPSPLIGPVLVINVKDYSYSYSSTLQLFADYFNSTALPLQVLKTTISHNGQYKFILPANAMLKVSKTYVDGGFGGAGTFTSLTLFMNQNIASPGAPYSNNVQYCPYTLLNSVTNMTVNGNLTYLDQFFNGTYVHPSGYSEMTFVNYTLSTTIWVSY